MATQNDLPIRRGGKLYRFISDGANAALFDRHGIAERLIVTAPGKGNAVPKVADADGNPVELRRASRPCSCVGMPWKNRYSELKGQVNDAA